MTQPALHKLLLRAGIASSEFWRDTWFRGCSLNRNLLLCPDRETAEMVARLFLPQLRAVLADVEVRTVTGQTVLSHWKPASLLKKQPPTTKRSKSEPWTLADKESDLLD